jgi:hypothetical protein
MVGVEVGVGDVEVAVEIEFVVGGCVEIGVVV